AGNAAAEHQNIEHASMLRATGGAAPHVYDVAAFTGHRVVLGDDTVGLVDVDDQWRVLAQFFLAVGRTADDDHAVTRLHQTGRATVQDDIARGGLHRVGLEARAVVDVEHMHLFELVDVGQAHQFGVERDRSDVVEARAGHRGAVDLRLHHRAVHCISFRV